MSEDLPLGLAPRPATGTDLLQRIRAATLVSQSPRLQLTIDQILGRKAIDVDGAGFDLEAVHGDWAGTSFSGDEPVMIFMARAR